jgi:ribonucleoside-diphosphate reductase alpha chain
VQSTFQKYTVNAVSKTINLSQSASLDEFKTYLLAYRLKSKRITVYRYRSKSDQVLTVKSSYKAFNKKQIVADSEFGGRYEEIVYPH